MGESTAITIITKQKIILKCNKQLYNYTFIMCFSDWKKSTILEDWGGPEKDQIIFVKLEQVYFSAVTFLGLAAGFFAAGFVATFLAGLLADFLTAGFL